MARRLIDQDPRREVRRQGILLDRLEVQFRARIRRELARAMEEMVRVFEATGEVPPARDHYENMERIYRDMATRAVLVFGGRVIQLGKDGGHILETKGFAETMTRLALQYVASEAIRRRITAIAETTRSQIIKAVAKGYEDGLGQMGVASYIRDLVPSFSTARAGLIARTETHGAANFGANEAAKQTGLPLKREWISAEDSRTRRSHDAANGQVVGPDEPFIVGGARLMYPGDPSGPADEVINCFPPDALILSAGLKGGIRRDYSGDLIQISFGGPVDLTVTPNHPVLTKRGWVAAGQIVEGDYLIYCGIGNDWKARPGSDVNDGYTTAQQLYDAGECSGSVGGAAGVVMDFHGEIVAEQVNVITFHGGLRDRFKSFGDQLFSQFGLTAADIFEGRFLAERMVGLSGPVASDLADGLMGSSRAGGPLGICGHGGGSPVAFGDVRLRDGKLFQYGVDHGSGNIDGLRNAVDGVTISKHVAHNGVISLSDDRPSFRDGSFEFRKCTAVKSFHYVGPVFNFESDTNLLVCNGIVNHNCRCSIGWVVDD